MKINHYILKAILLLLLSQTSSFATDTILSTFIEPLYNFYGENQYSVRGIGLGNTGISYKNNITGSLNNPATLSLDKKVTIELVYLGNRGKENFFNFEDTYLDQDNSNYLIGIGTNITEKLGAGITYSIEKNIQLRIDDIPVISVSGNVFTDPSDDLEFDVIGTFDYIAEVEQSSLAIPLTYKINSTLHLGVSLKYSRFKLKHILDTISGSSDVSVFSPQFGVLFSPENYMSLGITYVPETGTSKGTMNYSNGASETVPSKALPSKLGIGATLSPLDNLSASLEYLHRNYSQFSDLEDQSSIRVGLEYHPVKRLSLMLGYYSSPNYIKNPSGIPDIAQEFLTYGIGFNINKITLLNVSIQDSSVFKKGDINNTQGLVKIQVNL